MSVPILLLVWCSACGGFNVEDIMNAEYLPSTLLLEEAKVEEEVTETKETFDNGTADGDIKNAYVTMQFHRSKMNDFLCHNYLADEILSELKRKPWAEDRLGIPAHHRSKEDLLTDQGSSTYKDWLSRSTLLDDVYRHYDQLASGDGEGEIEDIESGEVTGYAVQQGTGKVSPPMFPHGFGSSGGGISHVVGSTGFGPSSLGGTTGYSAHPSPGYGGTGHGVDYSYHHHHEYGGSSKGLALKDLFDLALTALAFLAFGLFIMNLIMTCMIGNQGTTIVMQTTTTTTTGRDGTIGERAKRGAGLRPEEELNEMAYRVLTSVDRLVQLQESPVSARCLRYSLCENNRYSRSLDHRGKIWLPVWSFGLSWLSGYLGEDKLSNLRAAVLGLGNANCRELYPSCSAS